jgi:hypothetical protein
MLTGLMAFAVLSIDAGVLMTTRNQLQNAADAAALAGALALAESGGDEAVASDAAVALAAANRALVNTGSPRLNEMRAVAIDAADITFPEPGQVQVVTHRTRATGDPLGTYFLRAVTPTSDGLANVTATAVAGLDYLCGANCLKPFSPPDRWHDADGDGTFNPDPDTNPDEYYDPDLTGYAAPGDVGARVTIKGGSGDNSSFLNSHYYPVRFPPVNKGNPISGADEYRAWLGDCVDYSMIVEVGDILETQPGFMNGPTRHGVRELISLDPMARWDVASGTVVNSAYGRSPRVVLMALFDPSIGPILSGNGRNHLTVSKVTAMFIEDFNPGTNEIVGRFVRTSASLGTPCTSAPESAFITHVRLLQ